MTASATSLGTASGTFTESGSDEEDCHCASVIWFPLAVSADSTVFPTALLVRFTLSCLVGEEAHDSTIDTASKTAKVRAMTFIVASYVVDGFGGKNTSMILRRDAP